MKNTYASNMERFRGMIYGIKDNTAIKERIAPLYPEERLTLGETLYQSAKTAGENQTKEKNEAQGAINVLNQTKAELHDALVRIRQAGRYFFKNDFQRMKIALLDVKIPSDYAAWKTLVETTLKSVKTDALVLEKLTLIGLGVEQIDSNLAKVDSLDQLRINANKEDGEAQQATETKDATFNELKAYCSDLKECLKLFYTGPERQKLEEIGILVR